MLYHSSTMLKKLHTVRKYLQKDETATELIANIDEVNDFLQATCKESFILLSSLLEEKPSLTTLQAFDLQDGNIVLLCSLSDTKANIVSVSSVTAMGLSVRRIEDLDNLLVYPWKGYGDSWFCFRLPQIDNLGGKFGRKSTESKFQWTEVKSESKSD